MTRENYASLFYFNVYKINNIFKMKADSTEVQYMCLSVTDRLDLSCISLPEMSLSLGLKRLSIGQMKKKRKSSHAVDSSQVGFGLSDFLLLLLSKCIIFFIFLSWVCYT